MSPVRSHLILVRIVTVTAAVVLAACGSSGSSSAPTTTAVVAVSAGGAATTPSPTSVPDTTPATVPDTTPATTPDTSPPTTMASKGWAIHDALASKQSGQITNYDSVSCGSELGPWHIVADFTVDGNLTHDVFFDVTIGADGTGPLTGEEHSTWSDGLVVNGVPTGTGTLTKDGPAAFTLVLDYDVTAQFSDPVAGPSTQTDHLNKPLKVIPATATECP